ncbi:MAG: hypothetical protein R3227_17040 [Reinekea sp.]|nr:hypothetical protein [Reinekea sp.]
MSLFWIVFWASLGVFVLVAVKVWLLMKWVKKQPKPNDKED